MINLTLQSFLECIISSTSLICALFVIYLAVFCIKNVNVNVFAHMIVMNAMVDCGYCLANFVTLPVSVYCNCRENIALCNYITVFFILL